MLKYKDLKQKFMAGPGETQKINNGAEQNPKLEKEKAVSKEELLQKTKNEIWGDEAMTEAQLKWGLSAKAVNDAVYTIITSDFEELSTADRALKFLDRCIPAGKLDDATLNLIADRAVALIEANKGKTLNEIADDLIRDINSGFALDEGNRTNFPKDYSFGQRLGKEITNAIWNTETEERQAALSDADIEKAGRKLKAGDIVLVGNLRTISSSLVGGVFTHVMLHVGEGQFIHSLDGVGVGKITLDEVAKTYDTMAILRKEDLTPDQISSVVEYARVRLGKPYDYDFEKGEKALYCSELVANAFESNPKQQIPLGLSGKSPYLDEVRSAFVSKGVIHPMDFLKGDLKLVFKSHNVEQDKKGDWRLKEDRDNDQRIASASTL